MTIVTNGRLIYAAHPTGFQVPGVHTKYVEEQLDLDTVPLNGGILIKTLAISSDPYIRLRMRDPADKSKAIIFPPVVIGLPIDNQGVGIVVRSEDPEYKAGDYVVGYFTFENYSVYPGPPELQHALKTIKKIEKHPDLPASIYVGTLGMPGETAYSGWSAFAREKAKTSKTLFISSAAGPVGTFLIEYLRQIHPHLKIIASAGSEEKVAMLKEAGADVAFNYKTADAPKLLAEHGPIDIFWDHVGGATLDAALENMNYFGLIIRVGTAGDYNGTSEAVKGIRYIILKSLTMQGLVVGFGEAMQKGAIGFNEVGTKLVVEGKVKNRESRYIGLKEAGKALADVHTGQTFGKAVVIVAEE